jgi:hypothetical protein
MHIRCNAAEESFPDGPCFSVLLPFLFHALPCGVVPSMAGSYGLGSVSWTASGFLTA